MLGARKELPHELIEFEKILTLLKRVWLRGERLWCGGCGNDVSSWTIDAWLYGCCINCYESPPWENGPRKDRWCWICGDNGETGEHEDCGDPLEDFLSSPQLCNPARKKCLACINVLVFASDSLDQEGHVLDPFLPSVDMTLDQLLHHCNMYIFADTYDIPQIQCYAFCSVWLHLSVIRYQLQHVKGQDLSGFVDVMQHVIANTRRSDGVIYGTNTDKLCQLFCDFAIIERSSLACIPKFIEVVEQDSELRKEMFLTALKASRTR